MLKIFLLAIVICTVSNAAAGTAANQQFLPYNAAWLSNFGNIQNLMNLQDESDGVGMMLPQNLKPGQFVAFPGESDFAQVYGPGTNPVFQTGDMDVPMQIVNGRLVPVPKPDNDGKVAISPQFWQQQGLPGMLNPVTTAAGLIPAAPSLPGATQNFPLFATDKAGELFGFQGYGCLTGDCGDLDKLLQYQALAGLLNPPAAKPATPATTPTTPTAGTTTPATPATTPTTPATPATTPTTPATPAAPATPATPAAPAKPAAPAAAAKPTAAQNFNTMMMMMGGQNPLNDEDTNRMPFSTDFLRTLPGGSLIANYGNIQDSVYGESDAFIMGPNGPIFNPDNVDLRLQRAQPTQAAAQKPSVTEDPFFWAFLTTLAILLTGVSIFALKSRKKAGLEDVLMEQNYSSHV